ncbi:TPA: tail fiber domain-containing protein [Enterobacter hormaechei]|uniref:phage tail fiber protein n=1 Tax=Enterobacter hormaechei TaxID=158836 RepID=UPI002550A40B|nr:tail fiber domain-containing protein [Enterobacter hormaechei]EJQ1494496.1 tail fiber domain-containing protein [Salmonella enterica]MDL0041376.1 tail fiber domain-containing protein [Enterobacter hormaechei]HBL8804652.1 tail fiber domain-containing protein [Enterobacter hormaechei]
MWYREGTITFTQGSDTLEGTGTFWNVTANGVLPGMIVIGPDNKLYEIKRVLNDTRLTLMEQYSGETQNDVPCRIITTYEGDLTQFSARFTALMTRMSADSKTMRSWLTAIDEVTLEREDGTEVTVKSLTQIVNEHNANQQWYRDNTDAIDAAGDKAKQAAASAAAAANSASTAGTKATEASKSAAAAAASESVASEAAKGAKTSETNAESYKETAVASAATATEKAAEAGASASSAAASKNAAKASETNAAGSAVSAADSATAASNSAAAAKVSESNAAASENAAAGSAAAALASQNAAKTSETNAAQSADGSAASAAAAKVSETNAAASETATAASKVAAGLSADAAAGSATTAGEYADAAEASKDAAASSAGEAKKSEASAAASATTATDALAGIEAKATEAAESATLATAKASEASTSAAEAKASQTKAKASEDKAYEYAQNAQSSIASVKWKGTSAELDLTSDTPKWVKVSRARMPQATSTVYIEVIGGAGYDADSPGQAAMADIVLRTAGGDPKGLNAVAYLTQDSAVNSVATVNTDEENYDIYLRVGAGAQKLIVNLQFSGAAVESLEVIESIDSLPEGAVEGTVYHRVLSDINGAITGSLVGNASTATVLQTGRRIGGVLFDGSQDINLPGVNAEGNQSTSGNAGTASKLRTPRKIGGVNFDGSADINLPGVNAPGNQNTTGNAATATKLQTPRTINSVTFDGSANITIPTLVSRGRITALEGNAQGALAGIQMYEAYNNGYPTTYGNILHMKGAGAFGEGELLVGWSGTDGAHAPVYVRSRRDTSTANWSGWAQVYTTAHKPTAKDVGAAQAFSASYSTGAGNWTTAEFIAWLKERGAFEVPYWMMKGSWSYADNKIITDTGVGNICLAGAVIEVLGNEGAMTIRVTTPTTTTGGGIACAQFTYINHGSAYSPAWRRDYNTALKPTAADVGALPISGGTMNGVLTLQNVSQPLKTPGGGILANDGNLYINKSGFAGWIDALFLKNSGGTLTGNLRLSADNASIVCGNNGDIGFIKKQGYPGAIVTGSATKFMIMRSNAATNISAANTLTEVMSIQPTSNRADFVGEVVSHSANALRAVYGNYGFFIRNDGGTTYFLLTASGDKYGSWNTLRPLSINNASGAVSMGNGLSVGGGVNVTSGNIRIPTSSTSWIDMRNNAALSNSSAVATSSASAIIRQEHADRHYFVGGLGNSQFGFYMINKSRTANGTDANAYLQNDGTWVCGGNGNFNDVYIRSDRRSKRNIRKIERALDKLDRIEGVLYEIQVCDRYEQSGGLIAQDVQNVQPELVTVDHNDQSGEPRLRLNYNGVIGMLVEAVKELREEVRELRGEISVLKGGN